MTAMELLEVIGSIRDRYILEAKEDAGNQQPAKPTPSGGRPSGQVLPQGANDQKPGYERKEKGKKKGLPKFLILSAAAGLLLATLAGRGYFTQWTEYFSTFLVKTQQQEQYESPSEPVLQDLPQGEPEFAITFDPDVYTMTLENGTYYIRPIQPVSPVCEMEIQHLPTSQPGAAAQACWSEMKTSWQTISYLWQGSQHGWTSFSVRSGMTWDSAVEDHYFCTDEQQGAYHITLRYFMEASEGHGMHFHRIRKTFDPRGGSRDAQQAASLVEDARQAVSAAREESDQLYHQITQDGSLTQADLNELSWQRSQVWPELIDSLWSSLDRTCSKEEMQSLFADQMNWTMEMGEQIQQASEQYGGGSILGLIATDIAANMEQARADVLLTYLEGTAAPPSVEYSSYMDADTVVEDFTLAFFSNDASLMQVFLSNDFLGVPYGVDMLDEIQACSVSGLDNVVADMLRNQQLTVSVEVIGTGGTERLQLSLIWEADQWKVESFGLEEAQMDQLKEVLTGQAGFYSYDTDSTLTLEQHCQNFSDLTQMTASISTFSVVDLDHDGANEVLLWVVVETSDYGVLVLHMEDGLVVGYGFAYRQMYEIKEDGTFRWSGGAANNGIATVTFDHGSTQYQDLVWVETLDDQLQYLRYLNNGVEISLDTYDQLLQEQDAKAGVQWHAYPAESYDGLLG